MDRMKRKFGRYALYGLEPQFDTDTVRPRGVRFDKGGDPPPAPPAPDPSVAIKAQANAIPSVYSPFGTSVYSGDPNVAGSFTRTDTLSPSQQRQFDARNAIAESMLGRAGTQIGQLPTAPFTYKSTDVNPTDTQSQQLVARLKALSDQPWNANVDGSKVRDAYFEKQKLLLDPHFAREEVRLDQKLSNQGLPMGGEAFKTDYGDFARSRDMSYERAALDAITAGGAEEQAQFGRALGTRQQNVSDITNALSGSQAQFGQDYSREYGANQDDLSRQISERQQQYNELAALLGGQQLNPVTPSGSPVDANGALAAQQAGVNRGYQGELAGYNAGVSQNNAVMGGLFSLGAAALMSDRRLKRDIVRVGELEPGIGIYEFEYLWGGGRTIGVMAQEVVFVMPDAVIERPDGYLMVDYGRLLAGRTVH